jgi:hypothetical protein
MPQSVGKIVYHEMSELNNNILYWAHWSEMGNSKNNKTLAGGL